MRLDLDEDLKIQAPSQRHVQLCLYLGLDLDEDFKTQAPSQPHVQRGLYLGLDLDDSPSIRKYAREICYGNMPRNFISNLT